MRALKASAGPAAAKDPISEQAQEQLHVLAVSDIQIQIPAELEPGWNYTDPLPPPPPPCHPTRRTRGAPVANNETGAGRQRAKRSSNLFTDILNRLAYASSHTGLSISALRTDTPSEQNAVHPPPRTTKALPTPPPPYISLSTYRFVSASTRAQSFTSSTRMGREGLSLGRSPSGARPRGGKFQREVCDSADPRRRRHPEPERRRRDLKTTLHPRKPLALRRRHSQAGSGQ